VNLEEVIIIGAGPGGLATSLQLKRYGINPLIFERNKIGGLLYNANLVENYPGFPGGISGPDLVRLFEQQVRVHSLQVKSESVEELTYRDGVFQVVTSDQVFQARILVIATGTKPRKFIDFEVPAAVKERVFYEVYPVLDLKDQSIAIVGAGDAAFDYALNLGVRNHVLVLNRAEKITCLPLLWERTKDMPNISYHPNTTISRLETTPGLDMSLDCITPDGPESIPVDVLIGAIGRDAQLDFVSGQFSKKAIQLVSHGDLYYVGDVANGLFRQTAIAVGDGILAAMKIYRRLKEMDL
jgi:thioredoxin reductase (NADPH)